MVFAIIVYIVLTPIARNECVENQEFQLNSFQSRNIEIFDILFQEMFLHSVTVYFNLIQTGYTISQWDQFKFVVWYI